MKKIKPIYGLLMIFIGGVLSNIIMHQYDIESLEAFKVLLSLYLIIAGTIVWTNDR
jgi:hypothetical protein